MISILAVLLLSFSLDWAKKCIFNPVNYKYKEYGVQKYGFGCFKGCVGFYNGTDLGTKVSGDGATIITDHTKHREQKYCEGCDLITVDYEKKKHPSAGYTDEQAKKDAISDCDYYGNGQCVWTKAGKCAASSCPTIVARDKCSSSSGHEWKDGKCNRVKGDKCQYRSTPYERTESPPGSGSYTYTQVSDKVLCKDLKKYYENVCFSSGSGTTCVWTLFTDDSVKECKFRCEHPQWQYYAGGPWDYTRAGRSLCHNLLGCMYSGAQTLCSGLAIWAFVLILVLAILVFIAIIVVVVIIILKVCKGKSTKVSPEAAASQSKGAEATNRDPPPETGPYVVIKLGKQSLETKKVEGAVWGQSIIFTGLGAEDDDVVFELHDNDGAVLGSTDVRIPEYVNAKKRASIALKNGEVGIGVLEVDIEIQVQEEPEVKITGVFYVDKFTKV